MFEPFLSRARVEPECRLDVLSHAFLDNCTELRKVYPRGVARDAKAAGSGGATVDAKTYKLNAGADRDKDGIACE